MGLRHAPPDDVSADSHYDVLGVDETASLVDIRRAYRRLAHTHHPDKAGAASEAAFIRISSAYRVLSNSVERAVYDTARREGRGRLRARGEDLHIDIGPDGRPIAKKRSATGDTVPRFTGALDRLVAAGAVRLGSDGAMVLRLDAAEAASGGIAAIEMPLEVRCPTCGGISRPNGVWCRRCEFKGVVVQPVTILVPIPASFAPGAEHVVSGRQLPDGVGRTLRFRFERSRR